ncbi:MAG: hypothetical protein JO127_05145 [Caulobacteraceae bacterium]|nr:hypothetical protein [Caulobacteraceae bacterium]
MLKIASPSRLAAAAALALTMATPSFAQNGYNYHHHRHYYHHWRGDGGCERHQRRAGAIGAVAGTVGGALLGGALSHGNVGGTLLGAGGGALIGHAVAKHSVHC